MLGSRFEILGNRFEMGNGESVSVSPSVPCHLYATTRELGRCAHLFSVATLVYSAR